MPSILLAALLSTVVIREQVPSGVKAARTFRTVEEESGPIQVGTKIEINDYAHENFRGRQGIVAGEMSNGRWPVMLADAAPDEKRLTFLEAHLTPSQEAPIDIGTKFIVNDEAPENLRRQKGTVIGKMIDGRWPVKLGHHNRKTSFLPKHITPIDEDVKPVVIQPFSPWSKLEKEKAQHYAQAVKEFFFRGGVPEGWNTVDTQMQWWKPMDDKTRSSFERLVKSRPEDTSVVPGWFPDDPGAVVFQLDSIGFAIFLVDSFDLGERQASSHDRWYDQVGWMLGRLIARSIPGQGSAMRLVDEFRNPPKIHIRFKFKKIDRNRHIVRYIPAPSPKRLTWAEMSQIADDWYAAREANKWKKGRSFEEIEWWEAIGKRPLKCSPFPDGC